MGAIGKLQGSFRNREFATVSLGTLTSAYAGMTTSYLVNGFDSIRFDYRGTSANGINLSVRGSISNSTAWEDDIISVGSMTCSAVQQVRVTTNYYTHIQIRAKLSTSTTTAVYGGYIKYCAKV